MKHPVMGFENLHRHSDFSLLDGFARVHEYAERMKEVNQKYLCITDHGVMGAIPQQIRESDKHDLIPLFGCEMYVNQLQPKSETRAETQAFRRNLDEETQKAFLKPHHLLAIAYNNTGYSNLVRLTSWAWIHGFYKRPRVNHEVLNQFKEGIIFTSTCAASEIAYTFFNNGEEAAWEMIDKYLAMFGEHYYLELMMLDYKKQKAYNSFLLKVHDKYHTPVILTQDCHYCRKEHSKYQRLMLMSGQKHTIYEIELMVQSGDEDIFVLQDSQLWMKSEDELNDMWEREYSNNIPYEIFKQAKAETVKICQCAEGIEINRELKLPKIPDDKEKLKKEIDDGLKLRGCPNTDEYRKRIDMELDLIFEKDFASYFLIQKSFTDQARVVGPGIVGFGSGEDCVGPGRGSLGGSLVAYCLRLHDLDPILHDLRFSRFLSPSRGGKQMKIEFTIDPIPCEEVPLVPVKEDE